MNININKWPLKSITYMYIRAKNLKNMRLSVNVDLKILLNNKFKFLSFLVSSGSVAYF